MAKMMWHTLQKYSMGPCAVSQMTTYLGEHYILIEEDDAPAMVVFGAIARSMRFRCMCAAINHIQAASSPNDVLHCDFLPTISQTDCRFVLNILFIGYK